MAKKVQRRFSQEEFNMDKLQEAVDMETGEIISPAKLLNKVVVKETVRGNGTVRIQQDFSNCPSMAEQHTAHLTDLNYLVKTYKPDELAQYIAARNQYRQEIVGHDFSIEPDMQEAKNVIYRSKQEFEKLDDDVKQSFANHLEFLKFIDNPANAEKMIKLGILKPEQVENLQSLEPVVASSSMATTTTKEEAKPKEK